MISLHNIFSIAKYERKTLLRSWFFRIFSILSLLVLFGINFGMVIEGGGGDGWAIRSIPSAIPYFNLLILNVAQAVIAVFLASDFLKRDKKLDTTEVIYMRSMTNSEYVIGKTWGNLQVFLVLNIVVVGMALIFNMLAQETSVSWISYGFYLVAVSVPTLLFIMGLSFLLMSVIRNQAITFVLILGYIGITLFLLQAKYYYLFDYMAYNIPMLNSDIVGFGNIDIILNHRGIYFFLGVGFIFLTIFLLKRLPQSEAMTYISLIFSVVFIGAGGYLAYRHVDEFKQTEKFRAEVVELNNQYVKEKIPVILSNAIDLKHQGETIDVVSDITIKNENNVPLNKLIFNLNSGLRIESIQLKGKETSFSREKHLVFISENVNLQPGEEAKIKFNYSGKINEALCYLDIDEETIQEKYGKFVINVDKRYAFLTPQYVLLTPEANWYPGTGVTYSSEDVSWNHNQFVNYNLKVNTTPGLQAISQGKINEVAAGQFTFENEHPLTRLSLAIGNYEYLKMEMDSLEYGVWLMDGHNYFSEAFNEIKDTIPSIINEQLEDFERTYNLEYAFERLALVEAPAQFKTYPRSWTSCQEYVQPEQILMPEKGFMLRDADFEGSKKRIERWGNRGRGGSQTPEDIQMRVLGQFLRSFTEEEQTDFRGGPGGGTVTTTASPYFAFPLFYNFQNNIQSDTWPITNRVFEAYLKNQEVDMRSVFMRDMSGISEDEKANIALQDSTFEEILADVNQKAIIDNVIKLKGDALFSKIQYEAGMEEFAKFLQSVLKEYRFKNISFEDFDQRIKNEFGIELIPIMDDWFKAKELPGFLISPITAVKVKSGEMMRTMIKFKTTNFSDTEGLVKVIFRLGGGGGPGFGPPGGDDLINKLIYLEPHQTKDISYLLNSEPRMVMINTMTSQNIPQVITEGFRDVEEDLKANPFEGELVTDVPVQTSLPNETVVDNEDPQFEVTSNKKVSLLEKWIIDEEEGGSKYQGMNNWRPPTIWTAITNTDFYGTYVRSGYYIKSGDGSQIAKWHVPVKKPGYYDVYYYLYKSRGFRRGPGGRDREQGEYHFTIYTDEGPEEQSLGIQNADEGWNHLGAFYFTSDTALVELSNKSQGRVVFADAVKIVEL
ncbi:xanthan lyase [Maribellus comscasis]|uniref:Xanthan lyase n=1 Tax=Maribellus comscasis TaxID=2681766 RepID=A0A6I6JWQ1_9BACT|nr:xanthan lyase [Maribellus comscasis]QGY44547.1 xanthan lyase [Maribellus comscasis]